MYSLLKRLLGDDAITGCHKSHGIHLDESLAVETQAVDQGLKVAGQHVGLDQAQNDLAHGAEVEVNLVDEGCLQASNTGIVGADDREAGIGKGLLETFGGGSANSTDQRLYATHEFGMLGVARIVVGQANPIEEGDLGAGLDDAVDFAEEGGKVFAQTECLDLVESVEASILKGQGKVVKVLDDERIVVESELLIVSLGLANLIGIDVESRDLRAGVLRHVRGHSSATATQVQHVIAGAKADILRNRFLVQQLVLQHGRLLAHKWGDVHLLHVAQRAQVVEHSIVRLEAVADLCLIVRT